MALKARDHLGAGVLIGPHHLAQLFRITLRGEHGGIHEVTEQHGQLAAFRLGRSGGGWRRGRHGCGCGREDRRRRVTRPDQDAPRFIRRQALALDEFVFERCQVRVIELKLQLEGPIRQTAALAQEGYRLIHDRDKVHSVSSPRLPRRRGASLTAPLPCLVLGLSADTRVHHSISDEENAAGNTGVGSRM